ncbi:hypothetical protein [Nocardia wallacei]|uniref:hypothetical protein n=1 Tax=Nocardia wallacei TaxID=480035 RepID=UPI0024578C18|nr:hypothetical protein [Nocardia wallacei]
MTQRLSLAVAAATLAVISAVVAGCGRDDSGHNESVGGGGVSDGPLKDTEWFRNEFGTPLLAASTQLQPRAVEQAKDPRGVALPQNRAVLDGPVMWQRVYCEGLPFSTTDGPTHRRADTIWGGFAHTPLGAALAAYHLRNFGGTAADKGAIPAIAAPEDRDRIVPQLQLDRTDIPAKLTSPDCLAQYGIRRPARWHTEALSGDTTLVSFWYPPDAEHRGPQQQGRGYSYDLTVTWTEGDWWLTEQSIGDIGYSGRQKQPTPADEPVVWPRW